MDGLKLYEISSKHIVKIFYDALASKNLTLNDVKLVIPHQASLMAMKLIQKKLKNPNGKYICTIYRKSRKYNCLIHSSLHQFCN